MELRRGHTYIMGSPTGTLYVGVTSDIYIRVLQHNDGTFEGFSRDYGCTRLLYYETHETISRAIAREKQLKGWRRDKKLALVCTLNPEFKDLSAQWGWKTITSHERMNPAE